MPSPDLHLTPGPTRAEEAHLGHVLRMAALLVAMVLLVSAGNILAWRYPDPDDILRLVQVRDLLAGQGWFDLDQHRIDPLRDVPMHWSRLVDLPLALLIGALTPLVGQAAAEAFAVIAVPMLTLGVAMAFTGLVAVRMLGRETGGWAVLLAGTMPLLIHQFQPLRIDHHGWQIACLAVAFWGLSRGDRRLGPIVAGLAMAWGLTISIEMLPLAGLVGAIFALRWLRSAERAALAHYMQALAGGLIALFLATRGWPGAQAFCDAVGPAHLGFFCVTALGTTILRHVRPLSTIGTIVALGAIGAAGLACFGWASPACLGTPFGTLDPVVRDFWYVNVSEGRPIWEQDAVILIPFAQIVIGFVLAVLLWSRAPEETRGAWLEFLLLFAGTLLLGVLVVRSLAFASLLATIPFAWLLGAALARLRTGGALWSRVAVSLATMLLIIPAAPFAVAKAVAPVRVSAAEPGEIAMSSCDLEASARRLSALPQGTVFAPLDIGPSILLETGHGVIATGHHRADKAMRDVIGAFVSGDPFSRLIVEAYGADYLVMCTDLIEPSIYAGRGGEGSLAARLVAGNAPDWLEPVETGGPDTFRVWRVRD